MKRIILPLIFVVCLSGCAKLKHMRQLLTLKNMAEEGEELTELVETQNARFEILKEKVLSGQIESFKTQEEIVNAFGDPVYAGERHIEGQVTKFLMYRYSTEYLRSDKVYLYFNASDQLVDWELIPLEINQSRLNLRRQLWVKDTKNHAIIK